MRNVKKIFIFTYIIIFCCFHCIQIVLNLRINQNIVTNNYSDSYSCVVKHDILADSDNCIFSMGSEYDKELLNIKQIKIILLKFIDFINVGGCVYEEKSEC